jgi:hypothetical protein
LLVLALCAGCCAAWPSSASAAGPPLISSTSVIEVNATSAKLFVKINPNGFLTKYFFEYISDAGFQANRAAGREDFFEAGKAPPGSALARASKKK